jgi:hydrogenase maturation factor
LLISVPKEKLNALMDALKERGVRWASVIGEVVDKPSAEVWVEP